MKLFQLTREAMTQLLRDASDAAMQATGGAASMEAVAEQLSVLLGSLHPSPTKDSNAVRLLHDRLGFLINRYSGDPQLSPEQRMQFRASADALCWVLGCRENPSFAIAMHRAATWLRERGRGVVVTAPLESASAASLRSAGDRFVLVSKPAAPTTAAGIQCLTCLQVSWDPDDIANLFCGKCKVFHDEILEQDLAELMSRTKSVAGGAAEQGGAA
jgi:hypothetical protein